MGFLEGVERGSRSWWPWKPNSETLLYILTERVPPGEETSIFSDCWKAYNCFCEARFQHLSVNHSLNFVDPETKHYTNTVESSWCGVHKGNFVGYLCKYQFKRRYPAEKEQQVSHCGYSPLATTTVVSPATSHM